MTNIAYTNDYYYNTCYTEVGTYTYSVGADDSSGNAAVSSDDTFVKPPNWDIDMNGHINLGDLVNVSLKYDLTGPAGWIREDVDNDGAVKLPDLIIVSLHYDEYWMTGLSARTAPKVTGSAEATVTVIPSSQEVKKGKRFTVDIQVEPTGPITGVELKLSYDPAIVQAEEITEGDLFEPYNTFFSEGEIDNVAGTISKVYGLTVPATNTISEEGIFCTIEFTAVEGEGTDVSDLDLFDVGITNGEGYYISVDVNDGSVTTPRGRTTFRSFLVGFLERLLERFPLLEQLLTRILVVLQ